MTKKRNIIAALINALNRCGRSGEAQKVCQCGRRFRVFRSPCDSLKLNVISCDHPLCPYCSAERSIPLQRKILAITRQHGKLYRFLTLTVKNVAFIDRGYLDRMILCFRRLRETDLWKSKVRGGVYSFDTTYNRESGTWHVHFHVIIEVDRSLPSEWVHSLKTAWFAVTGDSWVIHMRAVNKRAVKELVKYQAKLATFLFEPMLVDQFLSAFKNVRRIQPFGSFIGAVPEQQTFPGWKCSCHRCNAREWRFVATVGIDDTVLDATGERQLKFPEMFWELNPVIRSGPIAPREQTWAERTIAELEAEGVACD